MTLSRCRPLPASRGGANLNTAAFDGKGRIWFTGQTGIYGRLDPVTGKMDVWDAPKGIGPYGITATPSGDIYYVSLAGSFLGKPDLETGETTVIDPKTKDAGTRRVWSDSKGAPLGQRMERRKSQRLRSSVEELDRP